MAAKRLEKPPNESNSGYRVFVSHATYDKFIARMLCRLFDDAGLTTFRDDRDIEGGDRIPEAIMEEIRNCDEFCVLLTPESIARQWVIMEIAMAAVLQKRIVPIFCHVEPSAAPDIIRDNRGYPLDQVEDYITDITQRALRN